MSTVGDLGRRIAERRSELGMTVEEVADQAGMSPAYVGVVESSPSPQLSRAALWRLASVLQTSADVLTGSGMVAPPGRSWPSARPTLEALSVEECQALVAPGGVGRLVFSDNRGPVALPVNFRVSNGDIVFRTEAKSSLLDDIDQQRVSFEVDHLDEALTEGWSVLLTGESRVIIDPEEMERARSLGVAPWAGGEREVYVCLVPGTTTGRRIRGRSGDE